MAPFDQLADRVSAALWNLHPVRAVRLGKHQYDGQVPDLSAGSLAAGYDRLRRLREQLRGLAGLAAAGELERAVLLAALDAEVLAGEGPAGWRRSPGRYLEPLEVGVYLARDYAPAGLRGERAAAVLAAAGEVLAAARENLEPVLTRAAVEWAMGEARARADRLDGELRLGGGAPDPAGERGLRAAATGAAAELRGFAGWLEAERLPRAEDGSGFGAAVLERVLWEGGPAGWPAAELSERARRALADDRAALAALGEGPPGETVPLPAGRLGGALREALGEAAGFARRAGVGAFPGERGVAVVEDPGLPAGCARLDPPGPYDDPATGAVLRVGALAACEVHDLAVSEGIPGRLLAVRRRGGAPGEVLRRFGSRAGEAGWALYAGEAMWEAGYRHDDPGWRRAWLQRALRADGRLVAALGFHAGEISLEQAEAFFREQTGGDEAAVHREAARVAVDPGCAAAGLGRLEIRDLRRRWAERFPGEGSGAFHEALLAHGAPPPGLLARVVLP